MPTPNPEQTIAYAIGKRLLLPDYPSIEAALRKEIRELDAAYALQTKEEDIKGLFVKYGYLDLTFQHRQTPQLLKIFCEATTVGYFTPIYKGEKAFDMDEMYAYYAKYIQAIDALFPAEVKIVDCCLTTDEDVWFEKHFYI
jgi:hypothetical protein